MLRWAPRQRRTDRQTLRRPNGPKCLAAAAVLHFKAHLELFFRQKDGDFNALGELAPLSLR